ncbi:hypothetical protein HMPREF1583_01365 [Gardnerella vaginalis JCP8151B]|nr:hypothetical protein HMPREF1583_01365 [Gardnerella vaginalis JCP8151B]
MVQSAEVFPLFVRDLGQKWYKMRKIEVHSHSERRCHNATAQQSNNTAHRSTL